MDGHGGSAQSGPGSSIRGRAHVDGGVPRPLGAGQVVWPEEVEPAADCRAARRSAKVRQGMEVRRRCSVMFKKMLHLDVTFKPGASSGPRV